MYGTCLSSYLAALRPMQCLVFSCFQKWWKDFTVRLWAWTHAGRNCLKLASLESVSPRLPSSKYLLDLICIGFYSRKTIGCNILVACGYVSARNSSGQLVLPQLSTAFNSVFHYRLFFCVSSFLNGAILSHWAEAKTRGALSRATQELASSSLF